MLNVESISNHPEAARACPPAAGSPLVFLEHEARALLERLSRIRPLALSETMVPAAALAPAALRALELHLSTSRRGLRNALRAFIANLGARRWISSVHAAHRELVTLRMRFNSVIASVDLFSDALSQRSERDSGVWLAGLDRLAADALAMPEYYEAPPLVCYLDRGIGAAIRRARTRLADGGSCPVAVIRVPRERMIGAGVASSLVHEVGHQAAALLDLVPALRRLMERRFRRRGDGHRFWPRWISEIVADFWSVAKLGLTATSGLIGVLSLPRPFIFRLTADDPHPAPFLRVKLSCALGFRLYPHAHWRTLAELWDELYPLGSRDCAAFSKLSADIPELADALLDHRPPALRGKSLREAVAEPARSAGALSALYDLWLHDPNSMPRTRACLACAAIGQARFDGRLKPEQESRMMARLLSRWALDPS
jgi:hypothetical protein